MTLTLLAKEPLTDGVVSFVWEPPAGFTWQAGQYMQLTLPHDNPDDRGIKRWFTIAAPPFEGKPRTTTRIATEHSSTFKQALAKLEPGDTIEANEPEGDFVLDDKQHEYVFIAGGIGFTPFHAILTELAHQGALPKIQVLYGVRNTQATYHEELAELSGRFPQLKVQYIVEPDRINEAVISQFVTDLQSPFFYISGPEPMVLAFEKLLQNMGVPQDNLRKDEFPGYTW
jgi:ferredoxin-NADP reductase